MKIYYLSVGLLINISLFISCSVFAGNSENSYYLKYKPKTNNLVSGLAFQPDPGESNAPAKTSYMKTKNTQQTTGSSQSTETKQSEGPPQPVMPPQPAHLAQPAVPPLSMQKAKPESSGSSTKEAKLEARIATSIIETEFAYFLISDFDFPDDHELRIRIWKDGKQTEEYYTFHKGVGVNVDGETIRYPYVDSICCIMYGTKGKLDRFSIDLNKDGKGLTDLPGCKVKKATDPSDSLNVQLPKLIPDYNM